MRRTEPNAILAINSTDRYTIGKLASPIAAPLFKFYSAPVIPGQRGGTPANDFVLQYPNALIYGYIKSLVISQIQINYHVPTIVPNVNDKLPLKYSIDGFNFILFYINLPYGFYTPKELAAMLQYVIRQQTPLVDLTVEYINSAQIEFGYGLGNGFLIQTNTTDQIKFPFANDADLLANITTRELNGVLRTYRLLGVVPSSAGQVLTETNSPNFLYTDYIDICSASLTKYQKMKDSDTSATKRNNILARIYLSGNSNPQPTSADYALGSQPFVLTADLNSPKVVRWSQDEAIYDLDFQLYDSYSEPLYWSYLYPTEFSATLLCVESED